MYQDPEYDKYTFDQKTDVECESRLDTCKALCCKLPFALSKQDVEEGIIRWEFGRPSDRAQRRWLLRSSGPEKLQIHSSRTPEHAVQGL